MTHTCRRIESSRAARASTRLRRRRPPEAQTVRWHTGGHDETSLPTLPAGCLRQPGVRRIRVPDGLPHTAPTVVKIGEVASVVGFCLLTGGTLLLALALVTKDFRFAYVAQYSSRTLPWFYSLSALWVGQAGSLLLWCWLNGLLAILFRFMPTRTPSPLRGLTFGLLMLLSSFLVATTVFAVDPAAASLTSPREGSGLSPLLQHPAMLIHPPVIFLGYAAWSIPLRLPSRPCGLGGLTMTGTCAARSSTLFAWAVLGGGILLGAAWAYSELGWGGYWGWDPVENGSLLPWLTGTAPIHALMVWQHAGLLKKTTVALAIATFGLCCFATFLTRSGMFSSLHAFSESPIGWLFLVLMIVLVGGGSLLIVARREPLARQGTFTCVLCRESMIAISMLILILITIIVCGGTLSTALSQALIGRHIAVGADFYNYVLIPTGLLLLARLPARHRCYDGGHHRPGCKRPCCGGRCWPPWSLPCSATSWEHGIRSAWPS